MKSQQFGYSINYRTDVQASMLGCSESPQNQITRVTETIWSSNTEPARRCECHCQCKRHWKKQLLRTSVIGQEASEGAVDEWIRQSHWHNTFGRSWHLDCARPLSEALDCSDGNCNVLERQLSSIENLQKVLKILANTGCSLFYR